MQAALKRLHVLLPDLTVTIVKIIVSADTAAVHILFTGTHEGELFGKPATHRPIRFIAFDMHRVAENMIAESWHLEDNLELLTQIGLIPPLG